MSTINSLQENEATLTLMGYKGKEEEINQDRSFLVSPFFATVEDNTWNPKDQHLKLMGVFDGHGNLGEVVSEYAVTNLPALFSTKLGSILSSTTADEGNDEEQQQQQIKAALHESFVEIDATVPTKGVGGCTASVIFQHKQQLYFANAGDSVSFLSLHHVPTNITSIMYQTREDKASIPEEKERVERMGGEVYLPPPSKPHATSRVIFHDSARNDAITGLAMSRSLGDWDAGKVGVIPDPIIDMLEMDQILQQFLDSLKESSKDGECEVQANTGECISIERDENISYQKEDVIVFAVSATDGMMDYVMPQEISDLVATSFAPSLLEKGEEEQLSKHLLNICKTLIIEAATGWHYSKQGRYRDDIAISVSKIKLA